MTKILHFPDDKKEESRLRERLTKQFPGLKPRDIERMVEQHERELPGPEAA